MVVNCFLVGSVQSLRWRSQQPVKSGAAETAARAAR
jgi:hypothetical protein